jgi:hypothetical protein
MSDRNPFIVNIHVDTTSPAHHLLACEFEETYTALDFYSRLAGFYRKRTTPTASQQPRLDNLYNLKLTRTSRQGWYKLQGEAYWGYPDTTTISLLLQPIKKDCLEISLEYVVEHHEYVKAPK